MVTVDRLSPSSSQQTRLDPAGPLQSGDVVEVKVIAMLKGNMARLAILGKTLDARTPLAFKAGATFTAAIEMDGGHLKLLVQKNAVARLETGKVYTEPPLPDSLAKGIIAAQAAINEALLSSGSNAQSSDPASARSPGQADGPRAGTAAALHSQAAEISPHYESVSGQNPAALPPSHSGAQPMQQTAFSSTGFGHPVQNSAQGLSVPFQLPQMQYPIEVRMKQQQDEDGESEGGGSAAGQRSWSVNVSLDGGEAGLVHVSVGFRASAVSVRLSSDRAEGVSQLRAWLPELKAVLEEANFVVGELSAQETRTSGTLDHDSLTTRSIFV